MSSLVHSMIGAKASLALDTSFTSRLWALDAIAGCPVVSQIEEKL